MSLVNIVHAGHWCAAASPAVTWLAPSSRYDVARHHGVTRDCLPEIARRRAEDDSFRPTLSARVSLMPMDKLAGLVRARPNTEPGIGLFPSPSWVRNHTSAARRITEGLGYALYDRAVVTPLGPSAFRAARK